MDIILDSLGKSIKHLQIIDEIFSSTNYPEKEIYNKLRDEIREFDSKLSSNKFSEEFYVGGKKRNTSSNTGYGRQMILSDIIEYIVNGRGYFYAIRNQDAMKNYVRIILDLINQLMIFDSAVVNLEIRKNILEKLEEELGDTLFKEADRKKEHEALLLHNLPVGFPLENPSVSNEVLTKLGVETKEKAIKKLEEYYDSVFPKALGLWGELLVYLYLLRKNIGFVFPLLLNQRLITGNSKIYLKPPDFLLLPFGKDRFYGIEVGAGKDIQSGNFSILTGIPTATKANMDNPKRCCICGKWMLFCPKVIEDYSNIDKEIKDIHKPIKCLKDCDKYTKEQILAGECPFAMHKGGKPQNHVMKMKGEIYHFHLKCFMNDSVGRENISERKIVSYYPFVTGLEELEKLKIDEEKIDKKLSELKSVLNKLNQHFPD